DEELEIYVDAMNSEVAGFDYIGGKVYVVQGWDSSRCQTTETWYHLAYEVVGYEELSIACTCRIASTTGECIHTQYFSEYHVEDGDDSDAPPSASVFLQCVLPCGNLYSMFSVESMSVIALRGRAIVMHKGVGSGSGVWKCSKDTAGTTCFHIRLAKDLLPEDFTSIPGVGVLGNGVMKTNRTFLLGRGPGSTISHLAIMPPPWARVPTDPVLYNDAPPIRTLEANVIFPMDVLSSCACIDGFRAMYNPSLPTRTRLCKLYTILTICEVQIQVQPCPRCPYQCKRYIGPDLWSYGMFNYNNKVLITHELLNEYTRTPFHAFRNHLVHQFQRDHLQFMGEDLFRSAWFAYVSLQQFGNDLTCTECDPAPTTVIWDGITLAFGHKHVTNTLRPPTITSEHSLTRNSLKYYRKQHALHDALLRRRVWAALEGPSLEGLSDDLDEEFSEPLISTPSKGSQLATLKRQVLLAKEHLNLSDWVRVELEKQGGDECPKLASLFMRYFGPVAYVEGRDNHTVAPHKISSSRYVDAVYGAESSSHLCKIAAEQSVLQLINYKQWETLCDYLQDPLSSNRYKLVPLPTFHKVLGEKQCDVNAINSILRWVAEKA
ncbi:hypothetical protein FA13DRAFT_1633913, partial [Coprinellus micaceus]